MRKKKIKIVDTYCDCYRISKTFTLELPNGQELVVNKWLIDSDWETDSGYEFDDENRKIFDELPEVMEKEILDFIYDEIKL